LGSKATTILFGFGMQAAKTLTYPVMCQFPLFSALSQTTNVTDGQMDRQTDERHACSTSVA